MHLPGKQQLTVEYVLLTKIEFILKLFTSFGSDKKSFYKKTSNES